MGSDTPPHITALFDQQQATQHEVDQLPDGVVAQVRIRRVDLAEGHALAASFTTNIEDSWVAAAVLLTLEGVATEFGNDVARGLRALAGDGFEGLVEAAQIMQLIVEGRKAPAGRVKRPGAADG